MDLEIITIKSLNRFSITSEKGDILDFNYFAQTLNMSVTEILFALSKNDVSYLVEKNVLTFKTKTEAKKAIKVLSR